MFKPAFQFTHTSRDWAQHLKIREAAVDIYQRADVIDLHNDSFLWQRLLGYQMERWHEPWPGLNYAPLGRQVDLPRAQAASMTGIVFDIPTNPWVPRARKYGALRQHISNMLATFERARQAEIPVRHVVSYADYCAARNAGEMAAWISIQGGQAIDNNLYDLQRIPEVHRITLIHFTRSRIGASNFDRLNATQGLSTFGKDFVQAMIQQKILVDLSHINPAGFWDAIDCMPSDVPPVVTHTGVKGVCNIWRNIDDDQIRAIAERGGTIGVIFERNFIANQRPQKKLRTIVDHMEHIIRVGGEDAVSLGSDYDGMITLPTDFPDIRWQPVLVDEMLNRGWSEARIRKILGENFLRVIRQVRPN